MAIGKSTIYRYASRKIYDVRPPDVDETPMGGELPRNYCNRVTRSKVDGITLGADEVALCGDTTVALGRQILGKPADANEARAFLQKMSGRRHRVITSLDRRLRGAFEGTATLLGWTFDR